MPFVRIDLVRGRDKAVLMRLVEEVSKVVADTLDTPIDRVRVHGLRGRPRPVGHRRRPLLGGPGPGRRPAAAGGPGPLTGPPVEVAAGRVEELPAGTVRLLEAAGRRVAVGNAGGRLFALDDTCLHRGGSLACGHLDGEVLVCPLHWWRYDVHSGRRLGQPGLAVASYPVRVVDGEVLVTVTPAPPPRSWREILLDHAREGTAR